jgi:GTPase SAR1 family protein
MKYDSTTNIIILGEQCSGKTLFINNYLYNKTKTTHMPPTIGVDYYKKGINYQDNNYLLKIWDTGNGLLYKNILEFYLKNSSIFIILTTEHNSIFIKKIFDIIHTNNQISPSNIIIIYNKKYDNDSFKFDESSILNYNTTIHNIYFHYINVMNNNEIQIVFNQIKFMIFTEFNNNLIPLNINDSINKKINKQKDNDYCNSCCTIC